MIFMMLVIAALIWGVPCFFITKIIVDDLISKLFNEDDFMGTWRRSLTLTIMFVVDYVAGLWFGWQFFVNAWSSA